MTENIQLDSPSPKPEDQVPQVKSAQQILSVTQVENLTKVAQNIISFAVGLGAFLTAGGFIVVNSYLARFTGIHGYNIKPAQYLAAGIGLIIPLAIAIFLLTSARRNLRFIRRTFKLARIFSDRVDLDSVRLAGLLLRLQMALLRTRVGYFLLITAYTIVFGLLYGISVYGAVPHFLGGGRPEQIVLVFKDRETPILLGLSVDPTSDRRTSTVLLLAELIDGFLVADTNTGHIATVKDELLTGIIDDDIVEWVITPTPTQTFTPSPTLPATATVSILATATSTP